MICAHKESGGIEVTYISTHNHPVQFRDTEHHPIPPTIMESVKSKLLLGASVDNVHKDLREGADVRNDRNSDKKISKKHAVTKRNLREIARKLKVNRRMHPDDATSVFHIVKKISSEQFDPVLLYKPQGEDVVVGPDDMHGTPRETQTFLFAMQTKEQLAMFEKHASKIVCLDSTHCTNKYDFKLVTLVVPDELNKGYPVAHLISNHEDEETLHYFFEAIKKRCSSDIKVNAVMTDDDNTGWKAFSSVFGNDAHHLLCKWHIHRSWRRRLHSLFPKDREVQSELYQGLMVLLEERDSTKFEAMCSAFIEKYAAVSEEFVRYFNEVYMNRPEKWAMCYRNFPHANTDTNMFVESFHNRLKTYYMQRRRTRRLDDLINLLLTIEEDDYWRHRLDIMYGKDERVKTTVNRHKRAMQIKDVDVSQVTQNVWKVRSQVPSSSQPDGAEHESKGESYQIVDEMGMANTTETLHTGLDLDKDNEHGKTIYKVEKKRDECYEDLCFTRCLELSCVGLCSHLYQCSCPDQSPMCKHIHKIHSLRVRNYATRRSYQPNNDQQGSQDGFEIYSTEIHGTDRQQISERKLKERAVVALKQIERDLDNLKVMGLSRICVSLEQLAMECSSLVKVDNVVPGQLDGAIVPPNEKLKLQFRPKRWFVLQRKEMHRQLCQDHRPKNPKLLKICCLAMLSKKKKENVTSS
eukprot:gene20831-22875_t